MERSRSPAAVVFDIGGVLTSPRSRRTDLAALAGAGAVTFEEAYRRHRDAYDLGGSVSAYWSNVALDAKVDLTREQVDGLDDLDARLFSTLAPGRDRLLQSLCGANVRTCLLSNAPPSLAARVRVTDWAATLDKVFSCEIGTAKPAAAAYAAVEEILGLRREKLAFFDDRLVNVAAARSRGWRAFVWESPQTCHDTLRELGVFDD